jgi:hypothetical protein
MSFFPLYSVVGPLIFFLSLLLMVWGGLRLIVTIFLRVIIIVRYGGCGVWVLTAFWGTLFQLAVSPFNWIDSVMEGMSPCAWARCWITKLSMNLMVRRPRSTTWKIFGKYPWWLNGRAGKSQLHHLRRPKQEI